MRIWDIDPRFLCSKHLVAEHRELHGLWNILTIHQGKGGYSNHPETKRWIGKNKALYLRHELLVSEFAKRGFSHQSPLDIRLVEGAKKQNIFINTREEQQEILSKKSCLCFTKKRD